MQSLAAHKLHVCAAWHRGLSLVYYFGCLETNLRQAADPRSADRSAPPPPDHVTGHSKSARLWRFITTMRTCFPRRVWELSGGVPGRGGAPLLHRAAQRSLRGTAAQAPPSTRCVCTGTVARGGRGCEAVLLLCGCCNGAVLSAAPGSDTAVRHATSTQRARQRRGSLRSAAVLVVPEPRAAG